MNLFQDEKNAINKIYETHNEIQAYVTREQYNRVYTMHKYNFHYNNYGQKCIMEIQYNKEVEKHLTEINYLGI